MPAHKTGFLVPFRAGPSPGKGLGVFATAPIAQGSVVWRHIPGVFTLYDEPAFRALIAPMPRADVVYELTHVHALEDFPGCLIRALDDGILVNHSPEPALVTNNAGPPRRRFDPAAPDYLEQVAAALPDDRYSLIATRDIAPGEEFTNDYMAEDAAPAFYDSLYEEYGIREDFLTAP